MKANVLVTAAGSIVAHGIIKSLRLASHSGKISYNITAADMSAAAAGLYRSDSGVIVPSSDSTDYIQAIISACKKNSIDAVFCGSDNELLVLSAARKEVEETGARLLVGDYNALAIARDKWKTFEFCQQNGLACAPSCLPDQMQDFIAVHGYPVVVKPREGYGSLHMYIANDGKKVEHAISAIISAGWQPMVQKYIPGELEFTSGVTVDRNARYVMSSISMRKLIKNGQTHKAFIDDYQNVRRSAESVSLRLGTGGAVNVQTKVEQIAEEPQVIEINPRFSATCPMRAVAGINEPDIVFRNAVLGEEIKVTSYERLFCARYHNEVYVPLEAYEKALARPENTIRNTGSFIPDYF
jgi:carbamoyl-phosphate synthase large subunit